MTLSPATLIQARGVSAVAGGLCLCFCLVSPNSAARTSPTAGVVSRFDKSDRSVLAEALADGRKDVVLNVLAGRGQNAVLLERLARVGGRVRFREDAIDYLSVLMPVDRADDASRLEGIEVVSVDMGSLRPLESPDLAQGAKAPVRRREFPPPNAATPRDNPYLPTHDIGAPQFIRSHPTFDGRGVTVGIVDGQIDLLVPELQTAMTLDGRPTRKIVEARHLGDPLDPLLPSSHPGNALASLGYPRIDFEWVAMRREVDVERADVLVDGISYRAPAPGRYRFGTLNERDPASFLSLDFPGLAHYFLRGDVNRDGNPPGSSGLFAVLWNEATGEVWVDTNQNHNFADERAMKDYAVRFDVGLFGMDDPLTPVREAVPFAIQTEPATKFVALDFPNGAHATMMAGSAVGSGFFNGAFDGVAPGAQLASLTFNGGADEHGIVEALIKGCKRSPADLLTIAVGTEAWLTSEASVWDVAVNRLVEGFGKLIVVAASNSGPGMATLVRPSIASKALSVGAYLGKDTALANMGAVIAADDTIPSFSSRGPRGDGALKPDILAPTYALTTLSKTFEGFNGWNAYSLPPGYRIGGGTSQASPFAAGGIALLMSAARQEHLPVDPARLKLAVANGARFLERYGAYEQGSGLMQISAAWEALRKLRDLPPQIVVEAPVRTTESANLPKPHVGTGLYEREGWRAGQRDVRTVTLTRTTGASGPLTFDLRWRGNDGTFVSQRSVTLPLNTPVTVPITVAPATAGVHSALLQIVDGERSLMIQQMAATVVAANGFNAADGNRVTVSGSVPFPASKSHFVDVPEGTPVLDVSVAVLKGPLNVRVHDSTGRNVDSWMASAPQGYQPDGAIWRRAFETPHPGVWEVVVENAQEKDLDRSFPDPLPAGDYTVTARILGAEVSPRTLDVDPTSADGARVRVANQLGPFSGGLRGSVLGALQSKSLTLTRGEPRQVVEIDVAPGTERLVAEIDGASDPHADVDLFLFDCTDKRCAIRAYGTSAGARQRVSIVAPVAGTWKVVVGVSALGGETVRVDYRDVLLHPLYGRLDINDTRADRASHAEWEATVSPRIESRPQGERQLVGFVELVADDVNEVGRTTKGIVRWPAALGRVMVSVR